MNRFRQYVPSIRQAVTPGLVADVTAARSRRLSLVAWHAAQAARLDLLPSSDLLRRGVIVDVGANIGDWTANALAVEPLASVIAVEPASGPLERLRRRFGADRRVTIVDRAVSDSIGQSDFFVTEHSHNASLHQPHEGTDALYGGGWQVAAVTSVQTTTVDALVQDSEVSVLKIDVQGAESEVLRGAANTLKHTSAVLLEVTFVSHYSGDATFPELHQLMAAEGFQLAGLSSPFMSRHNTALWCDACYVRA